MIVRFPASVARRASVRARAARAGAGRRLQRQAGVSLVEVLVSLFIVSMGVLALAGLVSAAARLGKSGESRAAATLLANDLADRLRANPAGASSLGYDWRPAAYPSRVAPPPPPTRLEPGCTAGAPCSLSEIAGIDLYRWRQRLYHALPGGYGYVQFHAGGADATSTVDVWVAWSDATSIVYGEALPARECPSAFGTAGATGTPRCVYLQVAL